MCPVRNVTYVSGRSIDIIELSLLFSGPPLGKTPIRRVSQNPLPGQQRWSASYGRLRRLWAQDKPQGRKGRTGAGPLALHQDRRHATLVEYYIAFIRITGVPNDPTEAPLQMPSEVTIAMSDQFPVFEEVLKRRGRTWSWRVCTSEGDVVMLGSESSRAAAKYKADRALFLLLMSAPYRSKGRCWWQTSPSGGGRIAPASAPKCTR